MAGNLYVANLAGSTVSEVLGAATTGQPVMTANTANLPANATTLIIQGFGFTSAAGNNTVTFTGGATGTVTSATTTQLTITNLSGLLPGSLSASVTVSGPLGFLPYRSSASVQVATV